MALLNWVKVAIRGGDHVRREACNNREMLSVGV